MSRLICIMGESGSGKTTAMRTLDPSTTYYIDCDGKGLPGKTGGANTMKPIGILHIPETFRKSLA